MTIAAVQAAAFAQGIERALGEARPANPAAAGGASFSQMLLDGIRSVDSKLTAADAQVRGFALDDSIPVHQVTYAIENARLSLELMLQVRNKLVDGYQQIMAMQL